MRNTNLGLWGLGWVLACVSPAWAFSEGGGAEAGRLLSVGGGISSPSIRTAMGENPAGLTYNQRLHVFVEGQAASSDLDPVHFGGLVLAGNGMVGGGLGLQTLSSDPGAVAVSYGLGFHWDALDVAFGAAGTSSLGSGASPSGLPGHLDLGALIFSRKAFRVGVTAYSVLGPVSYGVGCAYDASAFATVAVDAGFSSNLSGITIKPGVKIQASIFQLMLSYGIASGGGAPRVSSDLTAGVGANLGANFALQAYYNELSKYALSLMIRI